MNIRSFVPLAVAISLGSAQAAIVTFDNFTASADAAHAIRGAGGSLADATYEGALGFFSITDSAIQSAFSAGNIGAIASAFTQFGATFEPNTFGDGAFQAQVNGSTKAADNNFGTATLYSLFYKGATLATATELLIARMNQTIGVDDPTGFPPAEPFISIRPSTSSLVVGGTGAAHDFGIGGGPQSSFQLAAVSGVPEPTRGLLLLGGLGALVMRRRRA